MTKIGCCGIIIHPIEDKIVGIQCGKGRGLILPGGKFESNKDLTFKHAFWREMQEETGIHKDQVDMYPFLFHAMSPDGFYDYCFACKLKWKFKDIALLKSNEGEAKWVESLCSSIFNPYYDLLWDAFYNALGEPSMYNQQCFRIIDNNRKF